MPRNALIVFAVLAGSLFAKGKNNFLPKTFEANFVKEEKAAFTNKIIKVEGQIYYKYPSRIRLEERGGDKTIFVSNPFKTFYFRPSPFKEVPSELTVEKSNNYPLTKFFDSLRNGLESNALYKVKKKSKEIDFSFTPKGVKDLKIMSAKLSFNKKVNFQHIKAVEITLDNSKKLKFLLNRVKVDRTLKEEVFNFKAPKNTRVSQ